jgi:hypothetical protein
MPKVAYLITSISYNYVYNLKGTIDEDELHQFMLNEVSEYIINNSCSVKFETIDDVHNFWNKYNGYSVWDAYYVKNDVWINAKPLDENILKSIQNLMQNSSVDVKDEFDECINVELTDGQDEDEYVQDEYVQDEYVQDKYVQDEYMQDEYVQDEDDLKINWNLIVDEEIDWIE